MKQNFLVFLDTQTNCANMTLPITNGTQPDFFNINVSISNFYYDEH